MFLEGRFPVDVMPGLLRMSSGLLVSLSKEPIFELTVPNKIQAYLAVGKPIVASLNGEGARLIEESNSGLTAPSEDGDALAEAILKLYKMSDQERAKLGENGRSFFKNNFDENILIDELINHFDTLIKRS